MTCLFDDEAAKVVESLNALLNKLGSLEDEPSIDDDRLSIIRSLANSAIYFKGRVRTCQHAWNWCDQLDEMDKITDGIRSKFGL